MLDTLPETEEDTLALVITGSLTKDDYERLEPEMRLARNGRATPT